MAALHSVTLDGLTGRAIEVEVDIANGFPSTVVVGLADAIVNEARDRVRAAERGGAPGARLLPWSRWFCHVGAREHRLETGASAPRRCEQLVLPPLSDQAHTLPLLLPLHVI